MVGVGASTQKVVSTSLSLPNYIQIQCTSYSEHLADSLAKLYNILWDITHKLILPASHTYLHSKLYLTVGENCC